MEPYKYIVLDIETNEGSPDEVERWMRTCWKPNYGIGEDGAKRKGSHGPEAIGNAYINMFNSKHEKLALMDDAPIACFGIKSNTEMRCLQSLYTHAPRLLGSAMIEGYATEREVLSAGRNLLDAATTPETIIVGHNIKDFDLPHLRHHFLRNGLRPPACLTNRDQPIFDTMDEYCYRFCHTVAKKIMISVGDVLDALGLPNHKEIVTGADIGELIKAGKFDTVIQYNLLDLFSEEDLFLRMTGQAQDEAPRQTGAPKIERESAGELVSVGAPPTPAPATRKRSIE